MSKKNPLHTKFVKSMKSISKEIDKPESDISKAEFLAKDATGFSDWDLRKLGSFNGLKQTFFPVSEDTEGLDIKYGGKFISQHKNKLEKMYGQSLFYENEIIKTLKECLNDSPIILHKPVKTVKKKTKCKRTIVAAISDTHFGSNIDKKEMAGINEFNWTIASRRLGSFVDQIVNYKPEHRKETDLVVQLNGDIIAGVIHNQEWFADLIANQIVGTINILSQALSYLALHFSQVHVVCTPGNHGRVMHKSDKSRATVHKWDSFETIIYASLEQILKGQYQNISFSIPTSPLTIYKVQGHLVCQTHGDTVINVGNPGNSLNMSGISGQLDKINNSELVPPHERVGVLCVGHVHVPTVQILHSGATLVINGCLSGSDPFAQSIGIFSNNPTQVLFESTEKHAVGDVRLIQLKEADKNAKFDLIIKPFQKEG